MTLDHPGEGPRSTLLRGLWGTCRKRWRTGNEVETLDHMKSDQKA